MLTQTNRFLTITTPLGGNALLVSGLQGADGLSMPFNYELDLVSESDNIKFKDVVGKNVTVAILLADGSERYFSGVISRFAHRAGVGVAEGGTQLIHYSATVVPWFWLLTRTTDSRIFQGLSVPEIIEKIFSKADYQGYSHRMNLQGNHKARDYCVQYRETDFNFVSRLMEEEGIFYFFEHEDGNHTMVLGDLPQAHRPCPGQATARCQPSVGAAYVEEDRITSLAQMQQIRTGRYTVNDYNFKMPSTSLRVGLPSTSKLGPGELETYEYPGVHEAYADGEQIANLRMQAEEARSTLISGSSTCRAFASGYRFTLAEHYRDDMNNKGYVLTMVYHGAAEAVGTSGTETTASYVNSFTCIPYEVPFRPPRRTPKPRIQGVQTAMVTGPSGEEIYTDEYGQVKVQFHWDREGKRDDQSSCWIRVGQLWAGAGWGGVYIPRIGQEVIVDFLEGDPDRPIITGCVYHGDNKPPYSLPDHKTRSTIRSESTTGGAGCNEIRFEDKKGEEHLYVHAERNHDIVVLKDFHEWVGGESHLMTEGDQMEMVSGDNHRHVNGDLNEKSDKTISTQAGMDLQIKAGMNTALESGMEIHIKSGMTLVIEAGVQLSLKVGGNFIDIGPAGVSIQGTMVMINSGGAAGSGSGCSPKDPKDPTLPDTQEEPWK